MIVASIKFVFSYLGGCILAVFLELFKFGLVLMLTYMLGMAIFFVWERSLVGNAEKMLKARSNNKIENINPKASNAKYPFVVEIPMKKSFDSVNSEAMQAAKVSSKEEVEAAKAMRRHSETKDSDEEHDQAMQRSTI